MNGCNQFNIQSYFPQQHGSLLHLPLYVPVTHVDEGEDAVEGGHKNVRRGKVHQEVVGHTPHPPVGWTGNRRS